MHSSDDKIVWAENLDPKEASAFLAHKGVQASPATLANWRLNGSGPEFVKDGRRVTYERPTLEKFARDRRVRARSTSEATAKLAKAASLQWPRPAARTCD
jgi:hypothetical protein